MVFIHTVLCARAGRGPAGGETGAAEGGGEEAGGREGNPGADHPRPWYGLPRHSKDSQVMTSC